MMRSWRGIQTKINPEWQWGNRLTAAHLRNVAHLAGRAWTAVDYQTSGDTEEAREAANRNKAVDKPSADLLISIFGLYAGFGDSVPKNNVVCEIPAHGVRVW